MGKEEREMLGQEKRKYKRQLLRLDLSCHRVDANCEVLHRGRTVDVGPGGIFFETLCSRCTSGNLVKIDLSIPPDEGLFTFGGKISGFAKVLRTSSPDDTVGREYHGIAVEFCQPLKLST